MILLEPTRTRSEGCCESKRKSLTHQSLPTTNFRPLASALSSILQLERERIRWLILYSATNFPKPVFHHWPVSLFSDF